MLGAAGQTERSGEIYLPYIGHASENALLLRDGSHLAMGHVDGITFEMEEPAIRNARLRNLNTLLRNIADDNIQIATHLVRHADSQLPASGRFRSGFARDLDHAYRERVLGGRIFRNEYFLTITIVPRNALGKIGSRWWRRGGPVYANETDLRNLEDVWQIVESTLEAYGIRRLGLREQGDVTFSEIGEALALIRTGQPTAVPLVSGELGAAIYTDRVICGKRGFEIRELNGSRFGTIFSFREYPAKTRPGMLNPLLSVDFPIVMTQTFGFLTRAQAHAKLSLKSSQMVASGDRATSQIAGLADAEDALASNDYVMGSHHFSLAVKVPMVAMICTPVEQG